MLWFIAFSPRFITIVEHVAHVGCFLYTAGVWQDKVELKSLRKTERSFLPSDARTVEYKGVIAEWMRAMSRCRDWNRTVDM